MQHNAGFVSRGTLIRGQFDIFSSCKNGSDSSAIDKDIHKYWCWEVGSGNVISTARHSRTPAPQRTAGYNCQCSRFLQNFMQKLKCDVRLGLCGSFYFPRPCCSVLKVHSSAKREHHWRQKDFSQQILQCWADCSSMLGGLKKAHPITSRKYNPCCKPMH